MNTKDRSMTKVSQPMTIGRASGVMKAPRWLAALGLLLATTMPALAQCPLSFAAAVNYATGFGPRSVAVGDFNADGRPDLAVANVGDNVSILLGNANGTFQAAVNYVAGSQPQSVAVGDFNADGQPDLAVANAFSNNVSILLGNLGGTFQSPVNYAAGDSPFFVAVGDFNADGRPDLAVANQASHNVSILLGNPPPNAGTFQAAVNYAVVFLAASVTVGDFNADGRPDLAVANLGSTTVSILLGNVGGTFQAAVNYVVGDVPVSVAVGDFNADGRLDLAVANRGSNNVSILLGNAPPNAGTFQGAVNYAVGFNPRSVAVGDFNADGRPDLAVTNAASSNNVSILLGNVNGTFQAAVNYAVGTFPQFVAVGDFNADGRPDLAVANQASNNVSVLLNTPPIPVVSQQPVSVTVCPSDTAAFSVAATGASPFTYQWQWQPAGLNTAWAALSNGINANNQAIPTFNVSGATTPSMNISSISNQGSNLRCIVTNACGSVTSNEVTFAVNVPIRCSPADIAFDDGLALPPFGPPCGINNGVTEGDYNLFFASFFAAGAACDIADDTGQALPPFGGGGIPPFVNNGITEGDYNLFFGLFFDGCGF